MNESFKFSNLKESPDSYNQTIELIEKSFGYTKNNSFEVDFFPLISPKNHQNNHILLHKSEVIAHIGQLNLEIKINNKVFHISMYGGIAVNEKFRGQGLFRTLFEHTLALYPQSAFHILWSEKVELYKKYSFYPCFELKQYKQVTDKPQKKFIQKKWSQLSLEQKEKIKSLYTKPEEIRPLRSQSDWEELYKITSCHIFIDQESVENYFIKDKGEDLTDIIHEYGQVDASILSYGSLWSPQELKSSHQTIFGTLLKIGDHTQFKNIIQTYTQDQIMIESISENEVSFYFHKKLIKTSTEDFLTGIFGPSRFEELKALKPFLIPGLNSI